MDSTASSDFDDEPVRTSADTDTVPVSFLRLIIMDLSLSISMFWVLMRFPMSSVMLRFILFERSPESFSSDTSSVVFAMRCLISFVTMNISPMHSAKNRTMQAVP